MHEFNMLLSKMVASLYYYVYPKKIVVEKIVEVHTTEKDMNGIMKKELDILDKFFKPVHYTKGMDLSDVARTQGQQDVIHFIKHKLLKRKI